MADNLQDNEWNKFSEINGLPVVDIIIIDGTAAELATNVRLETLEADKFQQQDGKPVVRVNVVGGGGGGGYEEIFALTDWTAQGTMPETFKLAITHNLNTNTPDTDIFETDGTPTEMCVDIESSERIAITLFANEIFAGYIYVRSS